MGSRFVQLVTFVVGYECVCICSPACMWCTFRTREELVCTLAKPKGQMFFEEVLQNDVHDARQQLKASALEVRTTCYKFRKNLLLRASLFLQMHMR